MPDQPTDSIDFQGQLKYETIQFFFRRHWTRFLKVVFFGLIVGLLVFLILVPLGGLVAKVYLQFVRSFYGFAVILASFIYLNIFFLQIINYFFNLVLVTDCRIIITRKTVFLKNNADAIDLTKIQDIGVESHGLLRNYLGYGKLIITLSTSAPPVTISYVPHPHFSLERTNRVKREHILKRQERRRAEPTEEEEEKEDYLQDIHHL